MTGDARPEPSGVPADESLPPEDTLGDDGHVNPAQALFEDPADIALNDTTYTPQLGVKTTKAQIKMATLNI